ncbi:hypothetical protein [Phytomonospora endophytica]|uniref:Uncharacterized protein n=1 Tax=Phytomonospora endophytica TaxID=714109 RepID=A0A841FYB5_9ACTN|nr:hypothetical protein [Phytomonospora endophytica]MBB6036960.1 hypothetical protein [Phytomonospora endophytica]GIG68009.1 hypothetical protein Pen01_43040 [Phytomonospora endophytica]
MPRSTAGSHRLKSRLPLAVLLAASLAVSVAWTGAESLTWTFVDPPITTARPSLNSLAALAPDSVWAVGRDAEGAVATHWDGTTWTPTPVTEMAWLSDVSFTGPSAAWAVGGGVKPGAHAAAWDGSAWSAARTPLPDAGDRRPWLTAVDALDGSNAWAVGNTGAVGIPDGVAFLERWDGTEWTLVEPDVPDDVTAFSLSDIDVVAADEAWAVGTAYTAGAARPLVLHFDGTAWSVQDVPGQEDGNLTATTVVEGVVYAGGFTSLGGPVEAKPLLLRLDGDVWTPVKTPEDTSWWYGMVPDGRGGLLMTGYTRGSSLVLRFDGETAVIEPGPVPDGYATIQAVSLVPGTTRIWTGGRSETPGRELFVAYTPGQ